MCDRNCIELFTGGLIMGEKGKKLLSFYGLECVGFDTAALPSSDDILRKAFWVRILRHCRNDLHSFGLQQGRILWPI